MLKKQNKRLQNINEPYSVVWTDCKMYITVCIVIFIYIKVALFLIWFVDLLTCSYVVWYGKPDKKKGGWG